MRLWLLRLWPRARLPWIPPAATGGTCWNLTSLADFCNQHEDRTHPANDRPSREAVFGRFLVAGATLSLLWGSPSQVSTAPTVSGAFPKPKLRPDANDAGCAGRIHSTQHARSGAEANSGSSERLFRHRFEFPESWDPRGNRTGQGPHPTSRANGTGLQKSLRRLPLSGNRCRERILRGRQPFRRPRTTSGLDAPFSRPRPDCLDGHDRSPAAANHPRRTGTKPLPPGRLAALLTTSADWSLTAKIGRAHV